MKLRCNRQMLPGGSKEMSNLQAGYFDPILQGFLKVKAMSIQIK